MTIESNLRDRAIDALGQALNASKYWLPVDGRPIAVDAVLAITAAELDAARRRAIDFQVRLDEQRNRIRKIHKRYADDTCWADGEPYPCPTISALDATA